MDYYKLTEKIWTNKYIYWWITLFYGLCNIFPVVSLNWQGKKFWGVCILLLLGYCFLLYVVYDKRRFPKFSRKDYGILFAIVVENEEEYHLINKRFVRTFQMFSERCFSGIKTKMLNVYTCKQFDDLKSDKEKVHKLAQKNNYKFIIYGNSVFGNEQEDLNCKLTIEGFYNAHKGIPYNYHMFLMHEMNVLWLKVGNIEIYKKSTTPDFEDVSKQIEFVFQYILAMTHLLCGEYKKANDIFIDLRFELQRYTKSIPVVDELKNVVDLRIVWSYDMLANDHLNRYYQSRNKNELLHMKKYIDEANVFECNQYHNSILLGIYHFLFNRNVREAIDIVEACKGEKDLTWKQNLAFLKLYSADSIANFLYTYRVYSKLSLGGELTLKRVEELSRFICMVIEEEPNKKQLYFILFLIYYYIGNFELSDKYFSVFCDSYTQQLSDERMRNMLYRIGKDVVMAYDKCEA